MREKIETMSDLKYTVSETVYRRYGQIIEIVYEYDEVREEQVFDYMQTTQESRSRTYQASISRTDYEQLANKVQYQRHVVPFDTFVCIIRPFMMGTYTNEELREAFRLLDSDASNTIDLNELSAFLSVLHPNMSKEILSNYINKVAKNGNQCINFDEFSQMILRGIGRDIVCGLL
jgi:Ca2+-binding EF-hand superfamily protein